MLQVEGRAFPVAIEHRAAARPLAPETVAAVVDEIVTAEPDQGDLLVFLPGVEEIRKVAMRLEPLARRADLIVLPLHGTLSCRPGPGSAAE